MAKKTKKIRAPSIGLHPVPHIHNDDDLHEYLDELIQKHSSKVIEIVDQLNLTIKETEDNEQPFTFAFGKLLNFAASRNQAELVELLAGALWLLAD